MEYMYRNNIYLENCGREKKPVLAVPAVRRVERQEIEVNYKR